MQPRIGVADESSTGTLASLSSPVNLSGSKGKT